MDNIYTILKNLGIEVPEDKKEELNKQVTENYKTIAEVEGIKGKLAKAEEERDSYKEKYDNDIATRDNDLSELKKQLESAGVDKDKLTELTTKLSDLQSSYDNAKSDYEKQLAAQKYEFAVKECCNSLKFTSNSAKKSFIADIIEKKLPLENDKLLGFEEYVNEYKANDAGAFMPDEEVKDDVIDKPRFGGKTGHEPEKKENTIDKPKNTMIW